jgi:fructokinase
LQIGVDFGGSKIEAAILTPDGAYLKRSRVPNPGNYEAAIRAICELVNGFEAGFGRRGTVGIGLPGSPSPITGLMRNANSTYLNGRPFRADLSEALDRDVRLANDANCMALSEAIDGAAIKASVVFGIIIGTGCGGGLVIDKHLLEGHNGVCGEWGHNLLPWIEEEEGPGPQCWCGRRGCIETWVSGTGLQRDFHACTGLSLTGSEIIDRFRDGDPAATEAFSRFIDRFGRAIASVCNVVDPDVIVLAGGLSNVIEIYSRLPAAVLPHVFSDLWETLIVPAKWGDSAGVRGAAQLWPPSENGNYIMASE